MTSRERVRAFLEEFKAAQARPVTAPALVARMRTEATTWINAVHMQQRRVSRPLIDPGAPGDEVWRQAVDLHFLVVALTRLRRAVGLRTRVKELQDVLVELIIQFDHAVPDLATLRNVAAHFDDYTAGDGRKQDIRRDQLQAWSLGANADDGLIWRWLGVELDLDSAHAAATELYRGFLADADAYLERSGG